MKHHRVYPEALRTTAALLKFYEDHNGLDFRQLRECLAALERGDQPAAYKAFKAINMSHHGPFDWFPPVVFANENEDYVQVVFEALICRWQQQMRELLDIR